MEITFEVFQDLVRLLTEESGYSTHSAYNVISAAMDDVPWAVEIIEKAITNANGKKPTV